MKIRHLYLKVQNNSFLIMNNIVYYVANQCNKVHVYSILHGCNFFFKTENTLNKYVKTNCFLSILSEIVF